jgi:emfourin
VIIKIERSGGLVALPVSIEMDSKDLPSTLITAAKKVMMDRTSSTLPMKAIPKGAADYYSYKISIQDGVNRRVIECNEYNIQHDLKLLIKYIERNCKKRK